MSSIFKTILVFCLWLLAHPSFAVEISANPCFKSNKPSSAICSQYKYDDKTAYFRDSFNIEQKVVIKRVLSKANGQLVHANYDFDVKCHSQLLCTNLDTATSTVLWAFRNAIVENRLYEITYQACDPNRELCCDTLACQMPLKVDPQQSMEQNVQLNSQNDRREDRKLETFESITNIWRNLAELSSNEADFKHQVATTAAPVGDMPKFAYSKISSGSDTYTICKLESSGKCELFDGRMTLHGESGIAEFSHSEGDAMQKELYDFLHVFFVEERLMSCSQTMTCAADGKCNIQMTCLKR